MLFGLKKFQNVIWAIFLVLGLASAAEAGAGLTYHGRIIKPDGSALDSPSVNFKIEIRSPGVNNCLMYQELQTQAVTSGVFNLNIADGTVAPSFSVGTIDQVLSNASNFNFTGASGCTVTNSYNPTSGDGRNIKVYFKEAAAVTWEAMPLMSVNYVPYAKQAMQAEKVGLHTPASLLRVENSGTPSNATALTPANFTELMALILGTTTQYEKVGKLNGLALPTMASGDVLGWNGSSWVASNPQAGMVSSVVGTSGDITVSTVGAVATVDLATVSGLTTGTYGSATQVPQVTVDAKGRVTNVANVTITGVTPGGSASGDLTGTYPGPSIAVGAVTSAKILDGTITGADLNSGINISTSGDITAHDITATNNIVATNNVAANSVSTRTVAVSNAGNNTLSLTVPSGAFSNFALVLPSGDGTIGQVLKTDGSGNLYWGATTSGSVTSVGANAPLSSSGGSTPTLSISKSDATTDGYLASSDFATFSNKLSTSLNAAKIWVGNASNVAVAVAPSGDVAMDNAGAFTVQNQAISYAKIQNVTSGKMLGRSTAGAGSTEEISLGSGLSLAGGVLSASGTGGTVTNVTSNSPISVATGTTTPVISIARSDATTDGYLASTDFATFSNKLSTALASAKMWLGSAGGVATAVDMSGDATIANNGVLTIQPKAVTLAKMNDMSTNSILGRSTAGTGVPEVISVGAGLSLSGGTLQLAGGAGAVTAVNVTAPIASTGGATPTLSIARSTAAVDGYLASSDFATFSNKLSTALASAKIWVGSAGGAATAVDLSGDATIANTGAMTIAPQAVSYSKIQNVSATNRILGRATAGAGVVEEITLGSGLSLSGTTLSIGSGFGTVTNVTGTAPVQVATGTSTPVISMTRATAAVDGYLASTDFATFSNKLSTSLNSALIWVGNASNVAVGVAPSGDVAMDNAGAFTITNNAVTTAKVNNKAITYAKIQDVTNSRILGRATAGNGTAEEITIGSGLTLSGTTLVSTGSGGTVTNVSGTGPVSVSNQSTTPVITVAQSNATTDGYLASTDFATFSNKLSTALASAKMWVGSAGGAATAVDLSGDVSVANTGVVTIANKAVTLAKMNDMATASILGRSTAGTGVPEVITVGAGLSISGGTLQLAGGAGAITAINVNSPISSTGGATPTLSIARSTAAVDGYLASSDFATFSNKLSTALASAKIWVGSGGGAATAVDLSGDATIANTGAMTIAPQAVSYSKIQNVSATNRILGRATAGAGTVEEITLGSGLSLSGTTLSIGAGLGTVTSVTGTSPVQVATGTTTPVISMARSTAAVDGYLASTDFATFSNKLSTALASAKVWVGSAGGAAAPVDLSGDVSVANTGVVTIANKAVTLAKMNDMATASILGRSTAGTGVPEVITVGAGLSISGGTLQLAGGAGAITAVNVTAPIASTGGATPTLSMAKSTAAVDGYLASSDFATFSNKLSTTLNSALIWVGNASNVAVGVAPSGDVAMDNAGAFTITNSAVTTAKVNNKAITYAKIQDVTNGKILGRYTAGNGTAEEVTIGSGLTLSGGTLVSTGSGGTVTNVSGTGPVSVSNQTTTPVVSIAQSNATTDGYLASTDFATFSNKLSTALASAKFWVGSGGGAATAVDLSGDATLANTGVMTIAPQAVSYSKIQNVSTNNRILGRATAGAGTVEEITLGSGLSLSGTTLSIGAGLGTVTTVTGTSPVQVATGSTTPVISMARSTAAVDGYLASTDFATFSNKLSTALASAKVWVGSAGGAAAAVDLSGDVSIANTGAVTIANKAVTLAKMNDMATSSILGRSTAGTGAPEVISVGAGLSLSGGTLQLAGGAGAITAVNVTAPIASTGGATPTLSMAKSTAAVDGYLASSDFAIFSNKLSTSLNAAKIWVGNGSNIATAVSPSGDMAMDNAGAFTVNNQAISYAKMQNVSATNRILGRATAGAGTVEEITLGSGLSLSGTTLSIGAGLGTVTTVTGTSPVQVATGSTTPVISMARSTAAVDGYLASTDFATFSNKLSTALASAKVWVGSAGGAATAVDLSGDVSIANTGSVTIANKAVTLAKMNDVATNSIIGRYTAGTGTPEVITIGGGLSLSGGVLSAPGGGSVTTVSGTGPISVATGSTTPVISMTRATASVDGYLASTDFTSFSNKLSTSLNSALIWVGNGSNVATAVAPSGDVAMDNTGAFTINNNAVTTAKVNNKAITYAKIQDVSATNRLMGRYSAGSGAMEELTVGSGLTISAGALVSTGGGGSVTNVSGTGPISVSNQSTTPVISLTQASASADGYLASTDFATFSNKLSTALASAKMWIGSAGGAATAVDMSGDATIANTGVVTIQPKAITLAKMNDMATNSLLGRSTAGTGVPEVITIGSGLSLTGGTLQLTGSASTQWTTNGSGDIYFNSGKVGIGTASPNSVLEVQKNQNSGTGIKVSNTTSNTAAFTQISSNAGSTASWLYTFSEGYTTSNEYLQSGVLLESNGAGGVGLSALGTGNIAFYTTSGGSERMRITNGGNVGIGTTAPNAVLAVSGDMTVGKTSAANGGAKLDVNGAIVMSGSTSGYNGFKAAAVAGSTTWTLPSVDGSSGQSLMTNGSGTLNWGTPSAAAAGSPTMLQFNTGGSLAGSWGLTWSGTQLQVFDSILAGHNTATAAYSATSAGANTPTASSPYVLVQNQTGLDNSGAFLSMQATTTAAGAQRAYVGAISQNGANGPAIVIGQQTGATAYAERMRIDTSGNVGIGTTSPTAVLAVSGDATIGKSTAANGSAKLDVAGAIVMSGSTSGYVGFQPSAAAGSTIWKLPSADGTAGQVLTTNALGTLYWTTGGSGDFLKNGTVSMTGQFKAISGDNTAPGISFAADTNTGMFDPSGDTVAFATGGFERMRLDSAGKVGIGTPSPSTTLHILDNNSGIRVGRSGNYVSMYENGAGSSYVQSTQSDMIFGTVNTGGILKFTTEGNEHMRLDAVGRLGVGLTTINAGFAVSGDATIGKTTAANGKLDVQGSIVMSGSTSGYTGFQPSAAAGSTVWILPSADGTAGQVLKTNGLGTLGWVSAGGGSLSALTAATGTNTIANGANAQTWNWDSLTTGTAMSIGSNSMTSGNLLLLTDSFNSGTSTGNVLKIATSGATSAAVGLMITNNGVGNSLRINDDGTDTDSTPFVVNASGDVVIGATTNNAGAKLDVNGTIVSRVYNNSAGTTFDLGLGNAQYTTAGCSGSAWTLNNMNDGGTYTITSKSATHTGTCTFTATGVSTWHFKPTNATPASGHAIYTIIRMGSDAYVSWIDGF